MAKGDGNRMQNQINNQGQIAQGSQDALMNTLYGQNMGFNNNYNQGVGMNLGSYGDIMNRYGSFYDNIANGGGVGGGGGIGANSYGGYQNLANGTYAGWDPLFRGAFDKSISGFGNFADTGGFSNSDIQNIRARAVAPTRAVYANAQSNLDRNRALQGWSPNYNSATTRMARDLSYQLSDADTNAEAAIAQMVQQGKLAGLQGLTSAGSAGQGLSTNIDQLNLQAKLAGLAGMTGIDQANASASAAAQQANMAAQLGALGGMTELYGTTPGLINTFGNQLLTSGNQLLQGQGLQNNLGLGLIGGQFNRAAIPGDFQQAMGNIGSVVNLGAGILSGGFGFPSIGGFGGGGFNPQGITGGSSFAGAASSPADFRF